MCEELDLGRRTGLLGAENGASRAPGPSHRQVQEPGSWWLGSQSDGSVALIVEPLGLWGCSGSILHPEFRQARSPGLCQGKMAFALPKVIINTGK